MLELWTVYFKRPIVHNLLFCYVFLSCGILLLLALIIIFRNNSIQQIKTQIAQMELNPSHLSSPLYSTIY